MTIETNDTIRFGNQTFIKTHAKKRNPLNEIPILLASQKDKPFTFPDLILFHEHFKATVRYFKYLNAKQLSKILSNQ